jgi:deoxyhypusine monooxygenase
MNSTSNVDGSSVAEKSPFMSVDPAAPASFCSSVDELRYFV